MSTCIYDAELYTDIWKKENLEQQMTQQAENIKKQVEAGSSQIRIRICAIEINLDYHNKDLAVVV